MLCTLGYKACWGGCKNAYVSVVTYLVCDVYHLLPMCHLHVEVRIIIHLQVINTSSVNVLNRVSKGRTRVCVKLWNII